MTENIYFYDKIKILEALEASNSFPPEVIESLISKLKEKRTLMNYFVNNVKNVYLVKELHKRGFFYDFPSSVLDNKENLRGWTEGIILIRLADQIPDIISDIVRNKKKDDCQVYDVLLRSVIKLDVKLIKELCPDILRWLDDCQWPYLPDEYAKICRKFIEFKYYDEVQRFFEVILKPSNPLIQGNENRYFKHDEAIGKFEYWSFDQFIKPLFVLLEDISFILSLIELLEKYLIQSIDIECVASNSDFSKTSYWRSAIENHEQNHLNQHHKDFLLTILRDLFEKVIQENPEAVKDKINEYLDSEYIIFRRLALHLIRLGKNHFIDIGFKLLSDSNVIDELYIHHELFLLLRDIYPLFEDKRQKQIFSIIKQGTGDEKINSLLEWHKKNYPGDVKDEEYCEVYRNCWIRDRLQMINRTLKGSDLSYYESIISKYGENDHPDFTHYIGSARAVSQKPPINEDEWGNISAKECVDFMVTWFPKNEKEKYFEEISPEGMSNLFKQSLKYRWGEFVPEFERLITQSVFPAYSNVILDHISNIFQEMKKQNEKLEDVYNIGIILDLIDIISKRWAFAKAKEGFEYGYANSVCTRGLNVIRDLLLYLEKNKEDVQFETFVKVKNIIINLCDHPDPKQDIDDPKDEQYMSFNDPITVSINHIRPMSLRELLRYSICRSNILDIKDETHWEEDVKEKVTDILINDKAFSVRSVFGECWGWLFYLDREWASGNHKNIFPENYSDKYFITAWDSYITHKFYVNDAGYELMRPLYKYAIDNSIANKVTKTNLEPVNSLSEHLAGFYRFDIETLRMDGTVDENNPLEYVYSLKPNKLHSHMVWSLWRISSQLDNEEKCRLIWEKAKKLWGFRIEYVKPIDRNKSFSEELTWFLHFLNIKKLDIKPSEIKHVLTETIPLLNIGDSDHGIDELIKYLIKVSAHDSKFSIVFLMIILDKYGPGLYSGWYLRRNDIEEIIKNTVNSDFEVKQIAIKVIHQLGEYGQHWAREYLDCLRG